jgi:hypothetical protein
MDDLERDTAAKLSNFSYIITGDIEATCFTMYVSIYSNHNINNHISTVATANSYKHKQLQSYRMSRTSYIYCNCEVV